MRVFAAHKPDWLVVRPDPVSTNEEPAASALGKGERAAIALATLVGADLILMDDRAGVDAAHNSRLAVIGTLGVLELAALRGLVDLETVFTKLRSTNFRYPPALMDAILARYHADNEKE